MGDEISKVRRFEMLNGLDNAHFHCLVLGNGNVKCVDMCDWVNAGRCFP